MNNIENQTGHTIKISCHGNISVDLDKNNLIRCGVENPKDLCITSPFIYVSIIDDCLLNGKMYRMHQFEDKVDRIKTVCEELGIKQGVTGISVDEFISVYPFLPLDQRFSSYLIRRAVQESPCTFDQIRNRVLNHASIKDEDIQELLEALVFEKKIVKVDDKYNMIN